MHVKIDGLVLWLRRRTRNQEVAGSTRITTSDKLLTHSVTDHNRH